jgi:hypothetical protein
MSFKLYSQTEFYIFHFVKISETQAKLQSYQYSSNSSQYSSNSSQYSSNSSQYSSNSSQYSSNSSQYSSNSSQYSSNSSQYSLSNKKNLCDIYEFSINSFHSINGNDVLELKAFRVDPDGWFSGFLECFSSKKRKKYSLQFKDGRYSGISKGWFKNGLRFYKINFKINKYQRPRYYETQYYLNGGIKNYTIKSNQFQYSRGWNEYGIYLGYFMVRGIYGYGRHCFEDGRFRVYYNYTLIKTSSESIKKRNFFKKGLNEQQNRMCNIYKNGSLKFQLFSIGNRLNLPKSPVQRIIKIY